MYFQRFSRLPLQHVKSILFEQVCNPLLSTNVFRRQLNSLSQKIITSTSHQIRLFSNDGDSILETESFEDQAHEESMHNFSFRKILYLEDDPHVKSMNACNSAHELLQLCAAESIHFQTKHLIQAIILLWDFCRKSENRNAELQDSIKSHPAFMTVLDRLLESPYITSANESTCCYLYLKRIGLDPNHQLMQKLLQDILDTIKKDVNIPLSALSRFSVAVSADKNFNAPLVCRDMMPHVLKSLQVCTTGEELRLITICLANIRHLVSDEILRIYKAKIKELMRFGKINTGSTKCILRVLQFLVHPVWSHRNSSISRQLMILLLPIVDDMHENEVKAVFKVFQSQLEPAAIAPKLLKVSEKLLEECPTPEILACVVQFVEPKKREHLIDLFKNFMANKLMWQQPSAALHFFTILRALKISDNSLCDTYWTMVLEEIETHPEGKEHYIFSRHCHRYMYFNNNLGGTYRHIEFEKSLKRLCMNEIKTGISGVIPSKFANIAPFIIGYGHTYRENTKLPDVIVSKIESMTNQFTVLDCLQISRGIQIALEMRFRHFIPTTLKSQLEVVQKALNTCTQRHLKELDQYDANDLNSIVRALNNRKASRKSAIYQEALNKYNQIKTSKLNSRLLRNMSYNLSTSNFVAPGIIETMFDYIVKHEEYVTGDTVEKILSCSYNLGYSPQRLEGLYSSATIVMRDFDYMTGLSIIQACLALCFYKTIPEQLINKVFCVDFIKRIEEEIEVCYSKATYPERVLNQVMQLNRSVCLDFPEADVPWFQQNYLEAQLSKYPFVKSRYSEDVKQVLLSILKNESLFRCNHVTPYGYRIDFVIHFDKHQQAIPTPTETTVLDNITKVAILLLKLDSLCEKDLDTLCGKEALRIRHLEMLGYKVVHINEYEWNHLKLQDNRSNYLKCLLQISS